MYIAGYIDLNFILAKNLSIKYMSCTGGTFTISIILVYYFILIWFSLVYLTMSTESSTMDIDLESRKRKQDGAPTGDSPTMKKVNSLPDFCKAMPLGEPFLQDVASAFEN